MKTTRKLINVSELPELLAVGKMRMTKDELRKLVSSGKVSIDVAHSILGTKSNRSPVVGLPAAEPERDPGREPEVSPAPQAGGEGIREQGVRLRFRVLLIRVGVRRLDDDNLSASYKHVRDQIAEELGIDDGDPAIEWEYEQIRSRGAVGTIIRIERL